MTGASRAQRAAQLCTRSRAPVINIHSVALSLSFTVTEVFVRSRGGSIPIFFPPD